MQIYSNSPSIQVGGGVSSLPYINMSSPSAGMVRYNGSPQQFEVYDGTVWLRIDLVSMQSVGLSPIAEAALTWAHKKMQEEEKLTALCKQFPALQKAYDNLAVIKAMVENETQSTIV